ncbi:FtsK/SpoIIIE domain-containing protein [Caballeronia sp. LZ033]|uniref:FtsK/SpoIIIE domain-containing protein n=1 Tax=Caballeronia sp. LZ033 TaxID=3038566 RepID=UPI00285E12A3|nr:FtsK/SpoIIIE domain-containing protein [Caballeronia sp. LZ033]MDR5812315.1 FtsK/SpoIIIE domain-containing protein [Caballeronia sp. LZ033]
MTNIVIEHALSSRYRTSAQADRHNTVIMEALELSTRAAAARLAIGRSLSIPNSEISDDHKSSIDAKGVEVQGQTLFNVHDIAAWIGLVVTHARLYGKVIEDLDAFKAAVRFHWHRGAQLLMADWHDCEQNYDRFVQVLIMRRASLTERPASCAPPHRNDNLGAPPIAGSDQIDLVQALSEIGISAEARGIFVGPRLTRHEIGLLDVSQFDRLRKSLNQLALSLGLRDSVPCMSPGREAKSVLIDIARPRDQWTQIGFSELKHWSDNRLGSGSLPVFVGLDLDGANVSFDLRTAPHLLVGGATGMGKSVCLHTLVLSLLLGRSAETLQLALIDPKQVEFAPYAALDNLFGGEVVPDVAGALKLLQRLVVEMDTRYATFAGLGVSDIAQALKKGAELPYVVVVVEELADLVLQSKKIEPLIIRLAQKARAAGIHLILATQRPDAKTFSGLIRSNVPARIALTVQKTSESIIVIDEAGAESLTGAGDMLVKLPGKALVRAHGPMISPQDINAVVQGRLP